MSTKRKCKVTIAGKEVDIDKVIGRYHESCIVDHYKNKEANITIRENGTVGLAFKYGFMVDTYYEMYLAIRYISAKHWLPPFHVKNGQPDGLIIEFDEEFTFDSFDELHAFLKYFAGTGQYLLEHGEKGEAD